MKKTMVYLEDEQFFFLKRMATSSKKRMSEIIREALSSYLQSKKEKLDYFQFVGIAEGPKNGRTSEKAEEILKEILK